MKLNQFILMVGSVGAAVALTACGGGGGDDTSAPAPIVGTDTPVSGIKILDFAGGTPAPFSFVFGDASGLADTTTATYFEATATLANTGIGFGAVVAALDLPADRKNWAGASSLSIRLAGANTTQKVTIEIEKNGAVSNGCNPVFEQAVTADLLTYSIDLTTANFALPSFCKADAANPDLPGVLADVKRISVSDRTLPAQGTRSAGVRLGEIGVVGLK
jgi:hypothetical protein